MTHRVWSQDFWKMSSRQRVDVSTKSRCNPTHELPRRLSTGRIRDYGPLFVGRSTDFRIAIPALLALVSEPLTVLAATAIVGHLGTTPLAGLAIAATVLNTLKRYRSRHGDT
jgi:hypothetical protein